MPVRSRQDLLDEAFYRVELRVGTQYPCRQRDLDIIRQRPAYDGGPFVSSRRATLEIVEHNDPRRRSPSSYEREAIYRLSDAMSAADRHPWGPDLVIKAFLDLDLVFFRGALRGYVRLSWKDREHFSDGRLPRGMLAYTKDNESWLGHAHIYLNAEAILLGSRPFMVMFSTVLHEMCHAYEFVRVDPDGSNGDHDAEFGTKIYAVDRKARDLFGLEAIAAGESFPRYRVRGGA